MVLDEIRMIENLTFGPGSPLACDPGWLEPVYNSSVKLPALAGRYKPYRAREARITANHLRKLVVVD